MRKAARLSTAHRSRSPQLPRRRLAESIGVFGSGRSSRSRLTDQRRGASFFHFLLLASSSSSVRPAGVLARTSRHCHLRRQYGFNDCISFSSRLQFQNNYPFSSSPFLPSVRLFPYFFRKFCDSRGMDHSWSGGAREPAQARAVCPAPPRPPLCANHGPPLIPFLAPVLNSVLRSLRLLHLCKDTQLTRFRNSCICQTTEYRKPNCSKLD